jgi:nitrite reductase (NADH) small subunit
MTTVRSANGLLREVGPSAIIPPGEGRVFEVGSTRIAIFRTRQGELFATQAECPHRAGPLADGIVGGGRVMCPLHGFEFDLRTGDAATRQCGPLVTYVVGETADGRILLGPALDRIAAHV